MSTTSHDNSHCTSGLPSDTRPDLLTPLITVENPELASIMEDLRQLAVAIGCPSVKMKQAQLHRRLNELQSTSRALPLEVLTTIFHFASPPVDFNPSTSRFVSAGASFTPESHVHITLLSRVCWYWRCIIQSTPGFWSTAVIKIRRTPLSVQNKNSLLQLYLNNASNMLISLKLELNVAIHLPECTPLGYMELKPILDSILDRAEQFKLLSLISPFASWIPHISSNFTNLEDYRLEDTLIDQIASPLSLSLSTIPKLRQIYFRQHMGYHIPIIPPPDHCGTVTVLCMHNMPMDICVQMLILCPNLIEYRCHPSAFILSIGTQIPRLYFPHMKTFHAPCSFYDTIVSYHLHLPVIETLGLGISSVNNSGVSSQVITFLQHLPTTWSILTITFLHYLHMPDTLTALSSNPRVLRLVGLVKNIFRHIPPNIRSLHLPEMSHGGLAIILQALCDTAMPVFIPGLRHIYFDANHLPKIYRLASDGRDNDDERGRARRLSFFINPKLFFRMLWARKAQLEGSEFWLEMKEEDGLYWFHVEKKLQKLRSAGISARITQDEYWLSP